MSLCMIISTRRVAFTTAPSRWLRCSWLSMRRLNYVRACVRHASTMFCIEIRCSHIAEFGRRVQWQRHYANLAVLMQVSKRRE